MFSSSIFILFFRKAAGIELEGGRYLIHNIYTDEETLKLVDASCKVLGMFCYIYLHAMIDLLKVFLFKLSFESTSG